MNYPERAKYINKFSEKISSSPPERPQIDFEKTMNTPIPVSTKNTINIDENVAHSAPATFSLKK